MLQLFERRDGFGERETSAPMQQIKVDPLKLQPPEAALAGFHSALRRGVLGVDLGDDEHVLLPSFQRLADHFFGPAFAIHFSGIDELDALVERMAHGRDFGSAGSRGLAHLPGAKAKCWNFFAGGKSYRAHELCPAVDFRLLFFISRPTSWLPKVRCAAASNPHRAFSPNRAWRPIRAADKSLDRSKCPGSHTGKRPRWHWHRRPRW